MSDTTLTGWKIATTVVVIDRLPLQNQVSALTLVENYLSEVGGWIADDPNDPTGFGEPANEATPEIAGDAIVAAQHEQVYSLDIIANVDLKVRLVRKLPAGLTAEEAIAAVTLSLEQTLSTLIDESKLPLEVSSLESHTGTLVSHGILSDEDRQELDAAIGGDDKLIDPAAIALKFARTTYNLTNLWNVESIYNEIDKPIHVTIKKYTATDYTILDSAEERRYMLTLHPTTHVIITGSALT